jgi:hypothetical protein
MQSVPARRVWPAVDPLLFGAALVAYALALPLGLFRVADAPALAGGLTLRPVAGDEAPLALLGVRLFAFVPLGDLATRAQLAGAVWGAAAVAAFGRLALDILAGLRPPPHARQTRRHFLPEPIGAAAGALVAGLARASGAGASRGGLLGPGAVGPTLLLIGLGLLGCVRVARAPERAREALLLALVAGLAAGADPLAALLVWPPAGLLWLWALRRGERWPLVAPTVFVAGLVVALLPAAGAGVSTGALAGRLFGAPFGLGAGGARLPIALVAAEIAEQLGVIGLLVGAVGVGVLLVRAPFVAALAATPVTLGLLAAAASGVPDGGVGIVVVLFALSLPIAAGVAFLASRLGAARAPAAVVLGVTALVSPALDGGRARWRAEARVPARLLELAHERVPLRAAVDPGSAELRGLLRYGAAIGLRPDLELAAPLDGDPAVPPGR